jgi:hypothetical protein
VWVIRFLRYGPKGAADEESFYSTEQNATTPWPIVSVPFSDARCSANRIKAEVWAAACWKSIQLIKGVTPFTE